MGCSCTQHSVSSMIKVLCAPCDCAELETQAAATTLNHNHRRQTALSNSNVANQLSEPQILIKIAKGVLFFLVYSTLDVESISLCPW